MLIFSMRMDGFCDGNAYFGPTADWVDGGGGS